MIIHRLQKHIESELICESKIGFSENIHFSTGHILVGYSTVVGQQQSLAHV
jgi:hypothetical protein